AFAPDGKSLAVAAGAAEQPGDLRFWDLATGQETAEIREPASVRAVAYSPDGSTVATGEQDGTVRIRDAATGKLRVTGPGEGDPVHSVACTRDGKALLSASPDGAVKLRDVATGQERATFGTPADGVSCAARSADGATVAAGCKDNTVKLWDAAGKQKLVLKG